MASASFILDFTVLAERWLLKSRTSVSYSRKVYVVILTIPALSSTFGWGFGCHTFWSCSPGSSGRRGSWWGSRRWRWPWRGRPGRESSLGRAQQTLPFHPLAPWRRKYEMSRILKNIRFQDFWNLQQTLQEPGWRAPRSWWSLAHTYNHLITIFKQNFYSRTPRQIWWHSLHTDLVLDNNLLQPRSLILRLMRHLVKLTTAGTATSAGIIPSSKAWRISAPLASIDRFLFLSACVHCSGLLFVIILLFCCTCRQIQSATLTPYSWNWVSSN